MAQTFLNIEEAVKVWAHREYDKTATRYQRKLKQKEIKTKNKIIKLMIDWSGVRFESKTEWLGIEDLSQQNTTESSGDTSVLQSLVPADTIGVISLNIPSTSVLFQTSFNNNTDCTQKYTMRTEKTTRNSMTTEMEKGVTKGIEMGLKLETPCEIFEANVGYKKEFSLNKLEGETFEEEVSWGVEAEIEVKPGHIANACLMIEEKKKAAKFMIRTRMSGMVYIDFNNIHDNNNVIKSTGHDIPSIVKEYVQLMARKGVDLSSVVSIESDESIIATTLGKCDFRYGVKQEVVVHQKPNIKTAKGFQNF